MKASGVSFARLDGESATQLVMRFLLEGKMIVRVGVNDTVHDGYVHNMDFAKGGDHIAAWINIPTLGDDGESLRVSIRLDGSVLVLPDDLQEP